jgi:hypothetical protein
VDAKCRERNFPDTVDNKAALGKFPTAINESVNAQLSPLAHTIHHMQRWLATFIMAECADVHNILRGMAMKKKRKRDRV